MKTCNQRSEALQMRSAHPLLRVREMQTHKKLVIEIEHSSFQPAWG